MRRQDGSEAGRQRASDWLFKRLDGLRGVRISETGIFGPEGVFETWMFVATANEKRRSSNQDAASTSASADLSRRSSANVVISTHDVVSTNLLQFEARLQVGISTQRAPKRASNPRL